MESSDCLPKTHVSAKPKRRRIGTDTCPVPEGERAQSGASENTRLGTRQIGPVTSEEGVLRFVSRLARRSIEELQ